MSANKPYIVGLTGGIATGKSTASRHLTSLGAYCIDADKLSHDLMNAGGGAVEPIRRMFGDEVILPDGSVDRRLLGRVVFPDVALRRRLEGIIHPMVQHITLECIEQAGKNGVPLVIKGISANKKTRIREASKIELLSPKVQMNGSRICIDVSYFSAKAATLSDNKKQKINAIEKLRKIRGFFFHI